MSFGNRPSVQPPPLLVRVIDTRDNGEATSMEVDESSREIEGVFAQFPDETMLQIFSFLSIDSRAHLVRLAHVSQRWRRLVMDPFLWQGFTNIPSSVDQWIKAYGAWRSPHLAEKISLFAEKEDYPVYGSLSTHLGNTAVLNEDKQFIVSCRWKAHIGPSSASSACWVTVKYLNGGLIEKHWQKGSTAMSGSSSHICIDGWYVVVVLMGYQINVLFFNADPESTQSLPTSFRPFPEAFVAVRDVAFAYPYLALDVREKGIRVYDVVRQRVIYGIDLPKEECRVTAMGMDRSYLIRKEEYEDTGQGIVVSRVEDGKELFALRYEDFATCAWDFESGLLAVASTTRGLELFALRDGSLVASREVEIVRDNRHTSGLTPVYIAIKGTRLLLSHRAGIDEYMLFGGVLKKRTVMVAQRNNETLEFPQPMAISFYHPAVDIFMPKHSLLINEVKVYSLADGRYLYDVWPAGDRHSAALSPYPSSPTFVCAGPMTVVCGRQRTTSLVVYRLGRRESGMEKEDAEEGKGGSTMCLLQ